MKLHFVFASLLIVAVILTQCAERSYATHPSEVYRRKMLTKSPIPETAADLVQEKNTYIGVGRSGVVVDTKKPGGGVVGDTQKPGATSVGIGKGGVTVDIGKPGGPGISVDIGGGGVIVDIGKPGGSGTSIGVRKGGTSVDTHQGGSKPGTKPGVPVATSSPTT